MLVTAIVLGIVVSIPSSEQQEPTQEQLDTARRVAESAFFEKAISSAGGFLTIYIHIDTGYMLENVDSIAWDYYFQCLYDIMLEKARSLGIPVENLMSKEHITWEFMLHVLAFYLGFESAKKTDLNIEETPFDMFGRAFK